MKNRIGTAWSSLARHPQELTSRSCLLRHRLHSFDAVITPSMLYGAGTWNLTLEHAKMIRSTRRKMLRLIVETKRKYESKNKRGNDEKDMKDDKRSSYGPTTESEEEGSSSISHDHDSTSVDDVLCRSGVWRLWSSKTHTWATWTHFGKAAEAKEMRKTRKEQTPTQS